MNRASRAIPTNLGVGKSAMGANSVTALMRIEHSVDRFAICPVVSNVPTLAERDNQIKEP